jgi:predicted phosphoribosyltransferase
MKNVFEDAGLRDKEGTFPDREAAGRRLAGSLEKYNKSDAIVLAIPSGGVPVAAQVATRLDLEMDLIIARKVQFPDEPESGFGAVGPDGMAVLNWRLIEDVGMSDRTVQEQVRKASESVTERELIFRGARPYPNLMGRTVILVDDGLASGSTMMAAMKFVRKRGASKVVVAVPTGSARTVEEISQKADEVHCLNIRTSKWFAVADAYEDWKDMSADDVKAILDAGPGRRKAY